jgi:hypothetical protein
MAEFIRIVTVRPNGTERIVRDIDVTDLTDTQTQRADAFLAARAEKDAGQHVRVYTSSNGTVSPGDLVYDSDIDYGGTI